MKDPIDNSYLRNLQINDKISDKTNQYYMNNYYKHYTKYTGSQCNQIVKYKARVKNVFIN